MKVFRGPRSKLLSDDTHELVAEISPGELEESIAAHGSVTFNIGKQATERRAICTLVFRNEDIVPMISGLLARLQSQQSALLQIQDVTKDPTLANEKKIAMIAGLFPSLYGSNAEVR
jgi:hypothetical protein